MLGFDQVRQRSERLNGSKPARVSSNNALRCRLAARLLPSTVYDQQARWQPKHSASSNAGDAAQREGWYRSAQPFLERSPQVVGCYEALALWCDFAAVACFLGTAVYCYIGGSIGGNMGCADSGTLLPVDSSFTTTSFRSATSKIRSMRHSLPHETQR